MEESVFVKTNAVIIKLQDILKCQLCSEMKDHNLVFYFKSCGHFYCTNCLEGKICAICCDGKDVPSKLADDPNMMSLYLNVLSFKLPSRNELESILNSCTSSALNSASNENVVTCNEKVPCESFAEQQSSNKRKNDNSDDRNETMPKEHEKSKVVKTSVNDTAKKNENVDSQMAIGNKPETSNNEKELAGKKKINVTKTNHLGETRLHLACKKGDLLEMKNLIDAGADVNAQDNAGWTPLHDAINECNLDSIFMLLENGAKVNTPGLENNTPLHKAVLTNNPKICQLLMRYGADYKSKNILGDTPLDIAKSFNYLDVQEMLLHTRPLMRLNSEFQGFNISYDKHVVIWKFSLTDTEEEAVKKFAREFNADIIVDAYTFCSKKDVTHIVVSSNRKITLNWAILSSVLSGAWVVDSRWIFDSLNAKAVKFPKAYALRNEFFKGFEKSRLSKENQLPGLFSGCHFFFYGTVVNYYVGKIKITKDHLASVVKKNGGVILKRSPDPESLALEHTVPYHAREGSSIVTTSYFIIYQSGKNEPGLKYNMSHMKTLPVDWLILSIFSFKLIDPAETENLSKKFLQG